MITAEIWRNICILLGDMDGIFPPENVQTHPASPEEPETLSYPKERSLQDSVQEQQHVTQSITSPRSLTNRE